MVQSEGGFEVITRNGSWQKVVSKLGYKDSKNIVPMLRHNYETILFPYDIFMSGATTAAKVRKGRVMLLSQHICKLQEGCYQNYDDWFLPGTR